MAGINAFREAYVTAGALHPDDFESFEARKLRYDLYWALFENSVYRDLHSWAKMLKTSYGLYRFVRGVYNPAARIADAWQTFLMGGALDLNAGDGKAAPSVLPIVIPESNGSAAALRQAISVLWRDSNWQVRKDVLTLRGTVFGDIALKVVDDTERGKVYLEIVHPGIIKEVTLDPFGNVKGYVFEEIRQDPRMRVERKVTYRETAARDGENVVYSTYLDKQLYAWNGIAAQWEEPYGFIPLVLIRHQDVGGSWGWSEYHQGKGKFFEVDDLASKLHDQIRIIVHSKWLFAGVKKPQQTPRLRGSASSDPSSSPSGQDSQSAREEEGALYAEDANAKAQALVAPLQIADTTAEIQACIAELERDYPELQHDIWSATGDTSGKALSVARQRVETRVIKRRPNYDNGLVRAQQMAIAIGGWRGYRGYEGFDLMSYAAGALDHSVGDRPIFKPTRAEQLEEETSLWTAVQNAVTAGNTIDATTAGALLEFVLRRSGLTDEDLQQIGTMRAAAILNAQEDVIPSVEQ